MLISNELQYKDNICNEKYDSYHISKMYGGTSDFTNLNVIEEWFWSCQYPRASSN